MVLSLPPRSFAAMAFSANLLSAAWPALREGLGAEAHHFLQSVGHLCPRTLGSLDDMDPLELFKYFEQGARVAGVPSLT